MVQAAEPLSTHSRNCLGFDGRGEFQTQSKRRELISIC
jgi:hypothetical protein